MPSGDAKTLYLDAASAAVSVDDNVLRVERPGSAPELLPLRRVGRAVVKGVDDGLLHACLEIVRRGGTVHFQTGRGDVAACLSSTRPEETNSAIELAQIIDAHDGLGPFEWWQEVQHRHAWSLVFRRGFPGDFKANRKRLLNYLSRSISGSVAKSESDWLDQQLYAWIQSELLRQGLQEVVRTLGGKGGDLTKVLWQCLSVTTTWAYVRWRRQQSGPPTDRELTRFFELRAAVALPEQFRRHLQALAGEYHTSWSRLQRRARGSVDHG